MSEERLLAVQVDSYPPDRRAPEVRTAPLRMIDGFLEILAYTRLLLEGGPSGAKGFPEVAEQVQLLLDRAEAFRARQGFPVAEWRQALFAVCAWVDEQILCSAWDGRNPWLSSQLQRKYFDTSRAGELFFERLQALPEEKQDRFLRGRARGDATLQRALDILRGIKALKQRATDNAKAPAR